MPAPGDLGVHGQDRPKAWPRRPRRAGRLAGEQVLLEPPADARRRGCRHGAAVESPRVERCRAARRRPAPSVLASGLVRIGEAGHREASSSRSWSTPGPPRSPGREARLGERSPRPRASRRPSQRRRWRSPPGHVPREPGVACRREADAGSGDIRRRGSRPSQAPSSDGVQSVEPSSTTSSRRPARASEHARKTHSTWPALFRMQVTAVTADPRHGSAPGRPRPPGSPRAVRAGVASGRAVGGVAAPHRRHPAAAGATSVPRRRGSAGSSAAATGRRPPPSSAAPAFSRSDDGSPQPKASISPADRLPHRGPQRRAGRHGDRVEGGEPAARLLGLPGRPDPAADAAGSASLPQTRASPGSTVPCRRSPPATRPRARRRQRPDGVVDALVGTSRAPAPVSARCRRPRPAGSRSARLGPRKWAPGRPGGDQVDVRRRTAAATPSEPATIWSQSRPTVRASRRRTTGRA